jgi:ABC-type transporter Mla maintaining outer membrane lipid asymmetry ATPase subunit MlaF
MTEIDHRFIGKNTFGSLIYTVQIMMIHTSLKIYHNLSSLQAIHDSIIMGGDYNRFLNTDTCIAGVLAVREV